MLFPFTLSLQEQTLTGGCTPRDVMHAQIYSRRRSSPRSIIVKHNHWLNLIFFTHRHAANHWESVTERTCWNSSGGGRISRGWHVRVWQTTYHRWEQLYNDFDCDWLHKVHSKVQRCPPSLVCIVGNGRVLCDPLFTLVRIQLALQVLTPRVKGTFRRIHLWYLTQARDVLLNTRQHSDCKIKIARNF